ncbi:SMI1/KNR4 family protein [Halobaculum sp. MBLA0147]|uniref:SMI1/KNR4 family protein n=1 Tax=Halobaculum sp. MBLA0147 TaxID=3079934 RepID=UPI00352464BF
MERRWRELEAWAEDNAPALTSQLRPPATEAEIAAAEERLDVRFPPSVRESYAIHDGETCSWDGVLGYGLLSLSDLVETTEVLRGIDGDFDYDFWGESLVPVLAVGNGDYLCVRAATSGEETVFLRWDHESSNREELEPSFGAYFETVLDALRSGEYEYDRDSERLRVDVAIRRH